MTGSGRWGDTVSVPRCSRTHGRQEDSVGRHTNEMEVSRRLRLQEDSGGRAKVQPQHGALETSIPHHGAWEFTSTSLNT